MPLPRLSRRFVVPTLVLSGLSLVVLLPSSRAVEQKTSYRFDFGRETAQPDTVAVDATTQFSEQRGYGWVDATALDVRDRGKPDDLRRDFVMGKAARTFRVAGLKPGRYQIKIVCGDTDYGDHSTKIEVAGRALDWPLLAPTTGEFQTLTANVEVTGPLDITFGSPQNNWVVNALSLDPSSAEKAPLVTSEQIKPEPVKSEWQADVFKQDPTKELLKQFRQDSKGIPANFRATGLQKADYLKLISGEVDFWKQQQNANGAIIDPYRKEEWQYSTPAFAHAAALLVVQNNRADLLEPAAKAMDWATARLKARQAANSHEDFYPPMLAHALRLLKPMVPLERAAKWEANLSSTDPYKTYRQGIGSMNWNIVSSVGEAQFQQMGLRDRNSSYVADSLAAQGRHFFSPYGLYLEGPMAYDAFPRLWLDDMLAQGYNGAYRAEVAEAMRRAAITSLFMQSPQGELPAGGRSAHHQWNEAIEAAIFENYAAQAQKTGDVFMAAVYKRAAHLALASMQRWVRPSGEMQIVKNWIDPTQRHGYEGYSAHSQYNLLPTAMLALAYEYAAPTEAVGERPAPADTGGFVLEIKELHKVMANAGGTYVELDTQADPHYDATGLIRVHMKGVSPQLGPSDSLLAHASYQSPNAVPQTTGIGSCWQSPDGAWHSLGEMGPDSIKEWKVKTLVQTPQRVAFDVTYEGSMAGVSRVIEHYVLTAGRVELTTEIPGYKGALRYIWPVLADDGRIQSVISVEGQKVSVLQDGGQNAQTFLARGAQSVEVEKERYSNHNGWARRAVAQFPQGGQITLVIEPQNK